MASWLTRLPLPWRAKQIEGTVRPGPYMLSSGWLPAGAPWNFWQSGLNVQPYGQRSAMVEACVSAYSQTCAMLPGDHWRKLANGGRERVSTSALSRIMKRPNDYQSISDFMLNLVRRLYERGLLPPAPRVGAYRVVVKSDLPKVETALREAGYLREREAAGA